MPKSNEQLLKDFNANFKDPNLRASLESNKKIAEKYKNGLYEIIYGQNQAYSSEEKEVTFNEFFADLFDVTNIKWIIKNHQGQTNKELKKLLENYLTKAEFPLKLWITKFRSGLQGKYGMLLTKFETGEIDEKGDKYSRPDLIPVRVVYRNSINNKIFEISVSFDDFPYNTTSIFLLQKTYSIKENQIQVDSSLIDMKNSKTVDIDNLPNSFKENVNLDQQNLTWDFVPVSVLKNDMTEQPRCSKVKTKLDMLNKFDEIIAILPHWEKGSILFNGSPVGQQNNPQQLYNFMKGILLDGMVQMKPIDLDGIPSNLSDNVVNWNPSSTMQTMRNTRNDIYNEIKTDIGIPNMDEVKSAQQSTAEIYVKQFLTSPIIERETMLMKSFLIDMAMKFLIILKECNIKETFPEIDLAKITIDVDLNLNTDKNVSQIIKNVNNKTKISKSETEKEVVEHE